MIVLSYLSYSITLFLQGQRGFLLFLMVNWGFFEGVPKKIRYDNLKSVVLSRIGSKVQFNPRFMDFANHYLFDASPCNVRSPHEKGRVKGQSDTSRKTSSRVEPSSPSLTVTSRPPPGETRLPTAASTTPLKGGQLIFSRRKNNLYSLICRQRITIPDVPVSLKAPPSVW